MRPCRTGAERHWREGAITNFDGIAAAAHFSQYAVTAGSRAPLPSIDPPTAPPRAMLPTAAQARTQARYYVPTHVVTGIDKKAI